ncbi:MULTISPECIES: ComF family protein [unclassified Streptomyces]|uniref:ComF family protein n=1 Tax=unclassified Streptomyces TaxID=2593676 RepID=UPI002256B4E0|nr:phosphoribosyltransferase family protein [Streptomyces sp. NBC_01551]MCX4526133.1 phosphoribosyltransferase family protein [Streptomyces sp. NBC_01551]
MRGWWRELAGLVLPVDCAGCGAARAALCGGCRAALSGAGAGCVRPCAAPAGLPAVYAAAAYGGAVRGVVLAHKERGALPLAGVLGTALAGAVRAAAPGCAGELALIPVPSARRRTRARGHDPARRIALAASARLRRAGVPARVAPVLRLRRQVADQSGLGARERKTNLAGALEVPRDGVKLLLSGAAAAQGDGLARPRILLVDDIVTTGATLAEAARAVRAAGLGPVAAAAVVAAPADSFGRGDLVRNPDRPKNL